MSNKFRLGIMQPYFFPYLGYLGLIARTDKWVVFDVVQYHSKSWMNRNRILHPTKGWQYVGVPVQKASRGTLIKDILVKDLSASRERILGQLQHYKKYAPYFNEVTDLVIKSFSSSESDRLVDLDVAALVETCAYLNISFNWSLCSEMNLKLDNIKHSGQWALRISEELGADMYLNPPGGKEIFVPEEWDNADIELKFTEMPDYHYDCSPYEFMEHLSILDVLMWNAPQTVKNYLTQR